MSLLEKIKNTGIRYSLAILFCRIVPSWFFRTRKFQVFQVDDLPDRVSESTHPAPADPVTIKWAQTEKEFTDAEQLSGFERTSSKGRFQVAIAASKTADSDSSNVVGALWIATEQFDESELGLEITLSDDQGWLFSGYVLGGQRGQGIYRQVFAFACEALAKESKTGWFAINPLNQRSMKAHQKLNAKSYGCVRATRFLSMAYCSTSSDTKQMELSLNRRGTFNFRTKPLRLTIASRTCHE